MAYLETLCNMFPNRTKEEIQDLLTVVLEEIDLNNEEALLERMATLLTLDDNVVETNTLVEFLENEAVGGLSAEETKQILKTQLISRFPDACEFYIDDILTRESTNLDFDSTESDFLINGYAKVNEEYISRKIKEAIKKDINSVFPNACNVYINKCIDDGLDFDQIFDKFSTEGFVKANTNYTNEKLNDLHQHFCEMFRNMDPDFLLEQVQIIPNEEAVSNCITSLQEMKTYPTFTEYQTRQTEKRKMLKYLFDFKIDEFLTKFSNDLKCFEDSSRKHSLQSATNGNDLQLYNDKMFAQVILRYAYNHYQASELDSKLKTCKYDIIKCCRQLGKCRKTDLREHEVKLPTNSYKNELLFQELAYMINYRLIINYQNVKDDSYQKAYNEAKAAGQLKECKTCYRNGLLIMPEKCYQCTNGCIFCKDCMKQGCQVAFSQGLLEIECFEKCGGRFNDFILSNVMDRTAYANLTNRKLIKEIQDANIDGVETCPFCDYATEMPKEDKIFVCHNSKCLKESCRECRHESHIPLRCNEIEYEEDVKMRTYIEDQMTKALLRTCAKCNRQFIKEAGCNKMTCQCGQTMCYICGQSGIGYEHFGPTRCQLFTDQDVLHRDNVIGAAQAAKIKLGVNKNPNKLKFDPSNNM